VLGDFIQIQQVLLNLLMNAMDAMERVPAADRLILVSTRATPGGTVGLWVRDRGMGLPPTGESQLFEPFYTTKPQGLGLGLPICRSIVQAHGGTLTLANAETRGTVAHLSLPDLSRGKGAHDGHGLSGR
jgi:C4-dicarboxylate-specific signal transduction histidine kinase